MNFNVHGFFKKSFRKLRNPRMECRLWQNNVSVLQMYETTLRLVGKSADLR